MRNSVAIGSGFGLGCGLVIALSGSLSPLDSGNDAGRGYEPLSAQASAGVTALDEEQDGPAGELVERSGNGEPSNASTHGSKGASTAVEEETRRVPAEREAGRPSGSPPAASPLQILDDSQARAIAEDLVQRRDAALLRKNSADLELLSVEGSPVRAADVALLGQLADVSIVDLHTSLVDAKVVESIGEDSRPGSAGEEMVSPGDTLLIEVHTVQEILTVEGEAPVGPLPERCVRWQLQPDPWRIYKVFECD